MDWAIFLCIGLILAVLSAVAFAIIVFAASHVIGNRLRTPPADWKSYVKQAQLAGADLPPMGSNTGALRRQLVLRAPKVSSLSNTVPLSVARLPKSLDLDSKPKQRKVIYGFFHPYANSGGGGERVLWAAVRDTLQAQKHNVCAIYVGQETGVSPSSILAGVERRFGIEVDVDRIVFIFLSSRYLVDPSFWPRFTLLGQAIGSALLTYEALSHLVPDVWVDTMGYSFGYPVVDWLASIPICAYVHFPFVSSDMLASLKTGSLKWIYWRIMMVLYAWTGSYAAVVAANSSWTQSHIQRLWWWSHSKERIKVVYPPCATQEFGDVVDINSTKERTKAAVYLAQFRPEKRHELLLDEFAKLVKKHKKEKLHLILIGSVRTEVDKSRVYNLRLQARELDLNDDRITFVLDAPWENVKQMLASSSVGVNAMWNEHFGMGVVEYMAAGLIPVVHSSAGPKLDIVKDDEGAPGFFFTDKSDPDYDLRKSKGTLTDTNTLSQALEKAFELSPQETLNLRQRAYKASQRFSDERFSQAWTRRVDILEKLDAIRKRGRLMRGKYD